MEEVKLSLQTRTYIEKNSEESTQAVVLTGWITEKHSVGKAKYSHSRKCKLTLSLPYTQKLIQSRIKFGTAAWW